jgi:hypothetical protein
MIEEQDRKWSALYRKRGVHPGVGPQKTPVRTEKLCLLCAIVRSKMIVRRLGGIPELNNKLPLPLWIRNLIFIASLVDQINHTGAYRVRASGLWKGEHRKEIRQHQA